MHTDPNGSTEPLPHDPADQSTLSVDAGEAGFAVEPRVDPAPSLTETPLDPALPELVRELERRLADSLPRPSGPDDAVARERLLEALGRPDSPENYAIEASHPLVAVDPKINERLHAAGFTGDQAQLVYDLAAEFLVPLVGELRSELRAERELDKLRTSFGGERQWAATAEQLRTWGQANLDPDTYSALSSTAEGVQAMLQIMKSREPQLAAADDASPAVLDETALHAMIRDPRYWRSRDPEFIAHVTAGFERLFGR